MALIAFLLPATFTASFSFLPTLAANEPTRATASQLFAPDLGLPHHHPRRFAENGTEKNYKRGSERVPATSQGKKGNTPRGLEFPYFSPVPSSHSPCNTINRRCWLMLVVLPFLSAEEKAIVYYRHPPTVSCAFVRLCENCP